MDKKKIISDWFYDYSDEIYNFLLYRFGEADVEGLVQEVFISAMKWKAVISFHEKHEPRTTVVTPELLLDLKEENNEFFEAIQSLKATYRDVLLLRGVQGFFVSETGAILHWSESKVHSTYYRAKQALEKRLGGISYE